MLSRLASTVSNVVKGKAPQAARAEKGVPELLAALADVRARRAQLEREEQEILATTRSRLLEQQEALEQLKRRVHECGIQVEADRPTACAPPVSPSESSPREPALATS